MRADSAVVATWRKTRGLTRRHRIVPARARPRDERLEVQRLVVATFSSASLAIMSSADVAGFTAFSM